MSAYRKTPTKWLAGIAATCLALAIALSHEPAVAGASAVENDQVMTIDINVPLNEIQDGQFCQAYALVYNATSPYTFTWSGQFTNSDGSTGPLGTNQIVSGYVAEWRGDLTLIVQDSSPTPQVDTVTASLNIHSSNDYNPGYEA